jgi:hypothetical protein
MSEEIKKQGDLFVKKAATAAKIGPSSWRRKPYEPGQKMPFALSRSKVDMFLKCPRCFYLVLLHLAWI